MVDKKGEGLIIGGAFYSIVDKDTTYNSKGKSDIYIWSCDTDGICDGLFLLQGFGTNKLNDVLVDDSSNIYLTGSFEKELVVGEFILKSTGKSDYFLIKLNNKLEVIFAKQNGSYYNDYGKALHADSLNNIFVSGSFSGEFVSEHGDTIRSNGKLDVFAGKYTETGELIWMKSFGGIGNDYLSSCFLNTKNDLYLTGNFRGEIIEGDSKIISAGFSSDAFVAKYTSEGQFRFVEAIGDTNTDYASKIVTDSLNFIYLTGNFNQSMKVITDTTKLAIGEDFYLTKLYDCDFSPKISLPNDTSICENQFVIVADSGFTKYLWNEMPDDFEHSIDTTGNYCLRAYDEHGCITSDTIFVKLNIPVQVDLGDDIVVEIGDTVILTTNDHFGKYFWSTNDTTRYIELLTEQLATGRVPISVITTDFNGCISNDQLFLEIIQKMNHESIQVEVFPNPTKSNIWLRVNNVESDKTINYSLITESGVVILDQARTTSNNTFYENISLENLQRGVYYLKVQYDESIEIMKILKM